MSGDSNLSNGLVEQAKSISNNLNELASKLAVSYTHLTLPTKVTV